MPVLLSLLGMAPKGNGEKPLAWRVQFSAKHTGSILQLCSNYAIDAEF